MPSRKKWYKERMFELLGRAGLRFVNHLAVVLARVWCHRQAASGNLSWCGWQSGREIYD